MRRLLASAVLALSLLPASAFAATDDDHNSRGLHLWELRTKRLSGHRDPAHTDIDSLYDFYYYSPHRSRTHALHPYHRKRYYSSKPYMVLGRHDRIGNSYLIDGYEYDNRLGLWVRTTGRDQVSDTRDCDDFTYDRPNYRVPPFGVTCIEMKSRANVRSAY